MRRSIMNKTLINSCACYGSNDIHECYCNKQNNMKQTAVEWIVEQLAPSVSLQQKYIDELLEQAKAMEKDQIEDAWIDGMKSNQNNFQGI
jgi:hypothetical protein